jgi:hypothetical protein
MCERRCFTSTLSTEAKGFVELRRVYEQHWNSKSIELTDEIVTAYEACVERSRDRFQKTLTTDQKDSGSEAVQETQVTHPGPVMALFRQQAP